VDIWSLGLIFYMMLNLENPFIEATNKDQMIDILKSEKWMKGEAEFKKLDVPGDAIALLFKMLRDDPNQRGDIEVIINDPFIKERHIRQEISPFKELICVDQKTMKTLQYKIQNIPELHDLNFYLIYCLKDYFLDVDELFLLNEFYKYFDVNNDGIVEFDELINILKSDGQYKEEEYLSYSLALRTILNCNFRLRRTEEHLLDTFDYDYFLVANIILNLYRTELSKTQEKIRIMFKEIDEDGGGTLSVEEIQNHFTLKYNERKIEELFKLIKENKYYTKDVTKAIKDFADLDEEEFQKLIRYEVVDLGGNQLAQIKAIENREQKGVNDSNSKSVRTHTRSKIK